MDTIIISEKPTNLLCVIRITFHALDDIQGKRMRKKKLIINTKILYSIRNAPIDTINSILRRDFRSTVHAVSIITCHGFCTECSFCHQIDCIEIPKNG